MATEPSESLSESLSPKPADHIPPVPELTHLQSPVSTGLGSTPSDHPRDQISSQQEGQLQDTQIVDTPDIPSKSQLPSPAIFPQEQPLQPVNIRGLRYSVFEDSRPQELPKQSYPKDLNTSGMQAPEWSSINRRKDSDQTPFPNVDLSEIIEKWKARPPKKPENYQPIGWQLGKPEEKTADKTAEKSAGKLAGKTAGKTAEKHTDPDLCQNTTRCVTSSYEADRTVIDHLKRAQKRLRAEYEEFEEEVDETLEVQGINDKQHKRLRRIRARLHDQLGEIENDLCNFEKKKQDDHKRVLEYLGSE